MSRLKGVLVGLVIGLVIAGSVVQGATGRLADLIASNRNLTNAVALNVALVDGSGDHITSIGGGTQYTEADTDTTITGTAILIESSGDALAAALGGSGTVSGAVLRVNEATDSQLSTDIASMTADIDFIRNNLSTDCPHGNTVCDEGPQLMGEAKNIDGAALPNAVTEGQAARLSTTLNGVLISTLVNEDGSLSPLVVEDVGETAANVLMGIGTVRRDVAASSAGATLDNATLNTDALGLAWTRDLDPCSGVAKQYIPIDVTSATTTELTGSLAGASTHYYVCALHLVTDAANDVALADDDSDGCGSPTSGLAGGVTAAEGWNFAANGGMTLGSGNSSIMRTGGTNRVLCLVTSAATQLAGHLVVVAAP